jgi:hypothetical protein
MAGAGADGSSKRAAGAMVAVAGADDGGSSRPVEKSVAVPITPTPMAAAASSAGSQPRDREVRFG